MSTSHILNLTCPDRPGIVHAVTAGLLDVDGNIVENNQFTDPGTATFCMRTLVDTPTGDPKQVKAAVAERLGAIGTDDEQAGKRFDLRVRREADRHRALLMVSKYDHCMLDLLYRRRNGMLPIEFPLVVSNHPDLGFAAERYGVPFMHLPITKSADGTTNKAAQEEKLLGLIEEYDIDLVVLARYMQILSNDLCRRLDGRAINIHHSFLPGFKGAKPYHQAHARGVKLVGATAHFVTADLDEGPIIEQDVERVSHAHRAEELVELGQDTERLVLARAVRAWAEDRIHLVGDRTVVFP